MNALTVALGAVDGLCSIIMKRECVFQADKMCLRKDTSTKVNIDSYDPMTIQ